MGLIDTWRKVRSISEAEQTFTEIADQARAGNLDREFLQERIAELEFALEDEGWLKLGGEGEFEFSPEVLRKLRRLSRITIIKNPLVGRAVKTKAHYVFGQGVEIQARSEDLNEVVQGFLDDPANVDEFSSPQARTQLEKDLEADGELFFVLYTDRVYSGRVRVRHFHPDEITEIISNPEDKAEVRYYKREWTEKRLNDQGTYDVLSKTAYYPDYRFFPRIGSPERLRSIGGHVVHWDAPVKHVKIGGFSDMKRGIPEYYAMLDWAKAWKMFLEDTATVFRALARILGKFTRAKGKLKSIRDMLGTTVASSDPIERNPAPATGALLNMPAGQDFEVINKSGAFVKGDDGVALRKMASAGTDFPDTIISADPDMGNLATAKTLDRPSELAVEDRQSFWTGIFRTICDYVVDISVVAAGGDLNGVVEYRDNRTIVTFDDETDEQGKKVRFDRTVEVNWPPVVDRTEDNIAALVKVATLDGKTWANTIPRETYSRTALSILGVENIDDILEQMYDEEGNLRNPEPEEEPTTTQADMAKAAEALRVAVAEAKASEIED